MLHFSLIRMHGRYVVGMLHFSLNATHGVLCVRLVYRRKMSDDLADAAAASSRAARLMRRRFDRGGARPFLCKFSPIFDVDVAYRDGHFWVGEAGQSGRGPGRR